MNDGSGPAANLLAHGPNRDLRPAAEPQLAQDCLDVTLDRPLADLQRGADFSVEQAVRY